MQQGTHPQPVPGFAPAFVEALLDDMLDEGLLDEGALDEGAMAGGTRCHGIAGLQGSGKSTLAAQLAAQAARRGRHLVVLSIDDFYLDLPERERLAREVHPLLATRGPPGTHDIALACATLDALRAGESVALPRFDKLDDRRLLRERWPDSGRADLVLLEGWCLCVPPQAPEALATPVNELERTEDAGGVWRRYCNAALANDYPPLWRRLDRLLFLQPPGFEVVPAWRWQQERTLQAAHPERRAMDRAQVERFVKHYERVSRQALATLPAIADRVVRLDAARNPVF